MGVKFDSDSAARPAARPAARTSTRKRKAPDSYNSRRGASTDTVQITKVRKTGNPAFDNPLDELQIVKVVETDKPEFPRLPDYSSTKTHKAHILEMTVPLPTTLPPPPQKPSKAVPKLAAEEKRPKRFRPSVPKAVQSRLDRATTQRLIVLSRSGVANLEETFKIAGSTGNVYTIRICGVPACDCPDNRGGFNTCKHILYIMTKVLKAPRDLVYQAGLLSSELQQIFDLAPKPSKTKSNRKPLDEDNCPICFTEFRADGKGEEVVWCKAMCGSNVHASCFWEWKRATRGDVTCVMCRTPWQNGDADGVSDVLKKGKGQVGEDGYINVARELGMSGVRDISTYSEWYTRNRDYRW